MNALTVVGSAVPRAGRMRRNPIWRTVRLHAVNPAVFFGMPWVIAGSAWVVSMVVGLIIRSVAGGIDIEGMRYSWAVLSPQWYLVVVGVQAVGLTFSFALGIGSTRRDYWMGTLVMFVLVSAEMAALTAALVQVEKATGGWWLGVHMFDALWYGQNGWLTDFYTTFALQLLVLSIGAGATTVYMRWRIPGMVVLAFGATSALLVAGTVVTLVQGWAELFGWLAAIGIVGQFTLLLGLALACAFGGYLVIRRATPR